MKRILIAILFSFIAQVSFTQECILNETAPNRLVVDRADIISADVESQLENELRQFSRQTSNQILVVTVNDLCGYDKAEFTYTLGENWGVGQKEFDNGIVLMVKPHGDRGDRHTFIAVGYGLEGAIPDAIAKRVVSNELIPFFKKGQFEKGIVTGVGTLMGLAKGEIDAKNYGRQSKGVSPIPFFLVLVIIFILIFSSIRRVQKHSVGKDMSFWAALWLLSQSGHRRGGGWNDFHSGGGSFGGGFGGFGGGSFGGGGAGGSW